MEIIGNYEEFAKKTRANFSKEPLPICPASSLWHLLTDKQLQRGFWQGKQIFKHGRF